MRISLEYEVRVSHRDFPLDDEVFYHQCNVDITCQDLVEFIFYLRYGKYYNPLSWHLEDGARELVKDVEDSWLRDDIDIYSMMQDLPMMDFFKERCRREVIEECTNDHVNRLIDLHEKEFADGWTIRPEDVICEVE